jgi:hypothetical protein
MIALSPHEMLSAWPLSHLLLVTILAVSGFLVGRRGRLHLWHFAVAVALAALLLLPALGYARLISRPEAWLSVMRQLLRGWPSVLVALSLGCSLGVWLLRSGRRSRIPEHRPLGSPADA